MNGLPSSVKTCPNSLITMCVELLGSLLTIRLLGEVVSDHQVVYLVPIEQICAQSVPCMGRHVTHISNRVWLPWNLLDKFHIFPLSCRCHWKCLARIQISCFEHALLNTQMSIMYLFQYLLPQCGRYKKSGPLLSLVHSPLTVLGTVYPNSLTQVQPLI